MCRIISERVHHASMAQMFAWSPLAPPPLGRSAPAFTGASERCSCRVFLAGAAAGFSLSACSWRFRGRRNRRRRAGGRRTNRLCAGGYVSVVRPRRRGGYGLGLNRVISQLAFGFEPNFFVATRGSAVTFPEFLGTTGDGFVGEGLRFFESRCGGWIVHRGLKNTRFCRVRYQALCG